MRLGLALPLRLGARVTKALDTTVLKDETRSTERLRDPRTSSAVGSLPFRAADVPLVEARDLSVLCDADENYPAWEEAIRDARATVHVEMYIVHPDRTGRWFRDCLVAAAKRGVTVRVLYDWFGCATPRMLWFWSPLVAAGGEVRAANPPRLDDVFSVLRRDHRKLIVVDRASAFVSGLCVGDSWVGDRARGREPWRDTGVSFRGPAAAVADDVFRDAWALWGRPVPADLPPDGEAEASHQASGVAVGLVATSPDHGPVYRLELALAALAVERLWLTDAYFMPTAAYTSALVNAAGRGVDVRVLVPGSSDVQWVGAFSRTYYRRLIEGGVRVFEWDGRMLHAKSAVVDGRFARVGSTNLNISSWLNNWELDVVADDRAVGRAMEEVYERDLDRATEIVISPAHRIELSRPRVRPRRRPRGGRTRKAAHQAALFGSALGAALHDARHLGPAEARSLTFYGALLIAVAAFVVWRPGALAYPVGLILAWLGGSLLVRALRLRWYR